LHIFHFLLELLDLLAVESTIKRRPAEEAKETRGRTGEDRLSKGIPKKQGNENAIIKGT